MSDEDLEIIPVLKDVLTVGDLGKAVSDDIDIKDIESIETFDELFDDQQLKQLNKNIPAESLVTTKYDSEYEKTNDVINEEISEAGDVNDKKHIDHLVKSVINELMPTLETHIRSLVLSSLASMEKQQPNNTTELAKTSKPTSQSKFPSRQFQSRLKLKPKPIRRNRIKRRKRFCE